MAAGSKFSSLNIIYNSVLCHIYLIHDTLTICYKNFGGGFGGSLGFSTA